MESIKNLFIGSSGIAGIQLADIVTTPTVSNAELILKLVMQVGIGIITLIGLLKKNKNK